MNSREVIDRKSLPGAPHCGRRIKRVKDAYRMTDAQRDAVSKRMIKLWAERKKKGWSRRMEQRA